MFSYKCNQKEETPITLLYEDPFTIKYGYARASETVQMNERGQDYLAFQGDGKSISFVVCDGVSLSFFGDVAAEFLAGKLLNWLVSLSNNELQKKEDSLLKLTGYLNGLVKEGSEKIANYRLPSSLPPLLKDVLEEKRKNGSETMFVCGRIDIENHITNKANIFLAWAGDIRIRFWKNDKEIQPQITKELNTNERWSSKQGLIPKELKGFSAADADDWINRIAVYSDGFASIDSLPVIPGKERLQRLMRKSHEMPTSDDLSFIDISW